MGDQKMWTKERARIQREAERIQNLWKVLTKESRRYAYALDPELGVISNGRASAASARIVQN